VDTLWVSEVRPARDTLPARDTRHMDCTRATLSTKVHPLVATWFHPVTPGCAGGALFWKILEAHFLHYLLTDSHTRQSENSENSELPDSSKTVVRSALDPGERHTSLSHLDHT
jgi:hypothetical protein